MMTAPNIFILTLVNTDGRSSAPVPFANKQRALEHAQMQTVETLTWTYVRQHMTADLVDGCKWMSHKMPLNGKFEEAKS
jgi:hypothetical protein